MPNTTQPLEIHVPHSMLATIPEIKIRKGRLDETTQLWTLPDTPANREFAAQFDVPSPVTTSAGERIKAVAQTSVDLFNGLGVGSFRLIEVTSERIVITKDDQA